LGIGFWCGFWWGWRLRGVPAGEDRFEPAASEPNAAEAAKLPFPYAFSAQVFQKGSMDPVTRFSISMTGDPEKTVQIVNPLGSRNGLFHLTRLPKTTDPQFQTVSIIISAQGFQPLLQVVDLGADCLEALCPGVLPTRFEMQPLPYVQNGKADPRHPASR